jgi:hypothetical protein
VQERSGEPVPPPNSGPVAMPVVSTTSPVPTVVMIPPAVSTAPGAGARGPDPIGSAPVPRVPVATSSSGPFAAGADPRVALAQARDRYLRAASERKDLATPPFREELLRHALVELLEGARVHALPLAGATIAAVANPERPRHGPRAPMLLTLEASLGPRKLAVELHSGPPQATVRVLGRLCEMIDDRGADCAVLLRERGAPLPDTARRSQELVGELSARGGAVVWVDEDAALRLVGAGLLLDAAGAAEVLVGDRQASREEVLAYLLRDDQLGELLAPMIARGLAPQRALRPS